MGKRVSKGDKCSTCYSYGLWPIGDPSPLGPMDAGEWMGRRKKCPECGAGDV